MKRTPILLAASAVTLLAGCSATSASTTPDKPATFQGFALPSSSARSSAATVGDAITFKGRLSGARTTVTLVKVTDVVTSSNESEKPAKGNRYFGAQFIIADTGTKTYDDNPSKGAVAVDTESRQFRATVVSGIKQGQQIPTDLALVPGANVKGYIVYEVPAKAKIVQVAFGIDSRFGNAAQWNVPLN